MDETSAHKIPLSYCATLMIFYFEYCKQAIYMLVAGYFRLTKDVPKPVWRYPVSYIAFHTYAIQVSRHMPCTHVQLSYTVTTFDTVVDHGPWI